MARTERIASRQREATRNEGVRNAESRRPGTSRYIQAARRWGADQGRHHDDTIEGAVVRLRLAATRHQHGLPPSETDFRRRGHPAVDRAGAIAEHAAVPVAFANRRHTAESVP